MVVLPKLPNEKAREYAYRVLSHNINNFELKPYEALNEQEIGKLLGISRTPVREAMFEFARVGLVDIFPQRGTYVAPIDMKRIQEMRFLRVVLEPEVTALATHYLTEEHIADLEENIQIQKVYAQRGDVRKLIDYDNLFHRKMYEIADKMRLYEVVQGCMMQYERMRVLTFETFRKDVIVQDHVELLEVLKTGDEEKVRVKAKAHFGRMLAQLDTIKRRYAEYFGPEE